MYICINNFISKYMNIKRQYKLRKKRVTQTYIAQKLNITQGCVSQFLTGYRPIPKKYIKKLKNILNEA